MTKLRRSCLLSWRALWEESVAWLEFALAAFAIAIGVFVCLPFDTTTPPFAFLGRVWPEMLWGAVLLSMGLMQMVIARCDDECVPLWCEAFAVASGIVLWGGLSIFTFLNQPRATIGLVYAGFALGWLIVLWKMPLEGWDGWLDRFRLLRAFKRMGWPRGVKVRVAKEQPADLQDY